MKRRGAGPGTSRLAWSSPGPGAWLGAAVGLPGTCSARGSARRRGLGWRGWAGLGTVARLAEQCHPCAGAMLIFSVSIRIPHGPKTRHAATMWHAVSPATTAAAAAAAAARRCWRMCGRTPTPAPTTSLWSEAGWPEAWPACLGSAQLLRLARWAGGVRSGAARPAAGRGRCRHASGLRHGTHSPLYTSSSRSLQPRFCTGPLYRTANVS